MRRAALLLLALALSATQRVEPCAWGPMGEDWRFWLLQPELARCQQDLQPFYFSSDLYHTLDYDAITALPYAANIKEWQAIVGGSITAEDIESALYGVDPVFYFEHQDSLTNAMPFLRALHGMPGGWKTFFPFAKGCEQVLNNEDPWGFAEHDEAAIHRLWRQGEALLERAKDERLRARLSFQLVRLAAYGNAGVAPKLNARSYYMKHLLPLKGSSWLEGAAAFHLASTLDNPGRDLAFAEAFDRAVDKRFRMVQLFVSGEAENYLALAKDDQVRASLLVMRDLQHPGRALDDLERIAAWTPGNRHLPTLLVREVSKLEDWLLTPTLTDMNAAIRQWVTDEEGVTREEVVRTDLDYLRRVRAFIERIAPQADADQRNLLALLEGHLALMAGDLAGCRAATERVMHEAGATPLERTQARIDRLLAGIVGTESLTAATRAELLELVAYVDQEATGLANAQVLLQQVHLFAGRRIMERGEKAEGLLLMARNSRPMGSMLTGWDMNARHLAFREAAPEDFERMVAYFEKPEKTDFERYITGMDEVPGLGVESRATFEQTRLTRERCLDYLSMHHLREGDLQKAAQALRRIPDSYWKEWPYEIFDGDDPFLANVEDAHNYEGGDSASYTKRTIVERMLALQREAIRKPGKRALNAYLLGNAWFNFTWHGKYWIMSRIEWSMWEQSAYRDLDGDAPGDADYYGCQRAKEHYALALELAQDPVLKALACRMVLECERNALIWRRQDSDAAEAPIDLLDTQASRTAYRDIEECRSYRDHIRRYR